MLKPFRERLNHFLSDRKATPGVGISADRGTSKIPDAEFIHLAYQLILNRRADVSGFNLYFEKISAGEMSRDDFILALIQSEEFQRRYNLPPLHDFFMDMITVGSSEIFSPFVKKSPFEDIQLNELTNPFKWINSTWRRVWSRSAR